MATWWPTLPCALRHAAFLKEALACLCHGRDHRPGFQHHVFRHTAGLWLPHRPEIITLFLPWALCAALFLPWWMGAKLLPGPGDVIFSGLGWDLSSRRWRVPIFSPGRKSDGMSISGGGNLVRVRAAHGHFFYNPSGAYRNHPFRDSGRGDRERLSLSRFWRWIPRRSRRKPSDPARQP